jgi:hypothetical protein
MDKYEMNVRSLASQTFCSTLIGVASFSVEVQVEAESRSVNGDCRPCVGRSD